MIVVDASVAAKWLLPEKATEAALELQEGPDQLFAPELIRLEVYSSITRRVRAEKPEHRLTPEDALDRCRKWFRLLGDATLTLVSESDLLTEAINISLAIKHPLYDCMYLAAAQALGGRLVTADRPFYLSARSTYNAIAMLPGCEDN